MCAVGLARGRASAPPCPQYMGCAGTLGTPLSIPNPSRYPNLHPLLPASLQSGLATQCPHAGGTGTHPARAAEPLLGPSPAWELGGALRAPCLGCETFCLLPCWGNTGGSNTEQAVHAGEGAVNSEEGVAVPHSGGHPFASACHPPHCPSSPLPVTASLPPSSSPACPTGLSAGIPQPGCPQPESTANPVLVSPASLRPAVPTVPPHCHPSLTPIPSAGVPSTLPIPHRPAPTAPSVSPTLSHSAALLPAPLTPSHPGVPQPQSLPPQPRCPHPPAVTAALFPAPIRPARVTAVPPPPSPAPPAPGTAAGARRGRSRYRYRFPMPHVPGAVLTARRGSSPPVEPRTERPAGTGGLKAGSG